VDIGTIQAFLDGETEPAVSLRIADHISECDACSAMLAEAEEETAIVFPLLEREFNTLVPTQRLWTKINEEIEIDKQNTPFWKKLWTGIAVALSSPSIAVAASVLVVFGLFVALWGVSRQPEQQIASYTQPSSQNIQSNQEPQVDNAVATKGNQAEVLQPAVSHPADSRPSEEFVAQKAVYRKPVDRNVSTKGQPLNAVPASDYIPGEESYVKTIASLNQAVSGQKDVVMRPSERVSFERDMAVVNDSIQRMRQEVRKNPKNESAKQVLYSSYQNKIDLLNSVTQKEELMALK
jgi:hypothetical protein